jgi:hypothetical protein
MVGPPCCSPPPPPRHTVDQLSSNAAAEQLLLFVSSISAYCRGVGAVGGYAVGPPRPCPPAHL